MRLCTTAGLQRTQTLDRYCSRPTETATDRNKDALYNELNMLISKTPRQQAVIAGIDANAKMGLEQQSDGLGRCFYPMEQTSYNENRLIDLCEQTNLIIASTFERNHRRDQPSARLHPDKEHPLVRSPKINSCLGRRIRFRPPISSSQHHKMNNGKSGGDGGTSAEMLKSFPPPRIEARFYNCSPQEAIHGTHVTEPKNYRGTSLLRIMYEIFKRTTLDQLIRHREETTSDEQAVFRPGRSMTDHSFFAVDDIMHRTVEQCHVDVILAPSARLFQRCAEANSAFDSLTKCLWSAPIDYKAKLQVSLSAIRPIMMYGSVTWESGLAVKITAQIRAADEPGGGASSNEVAEMAERLSQLLLRPLTIKRLVGMVDIIVFKTRAGPPCTSMMLHDNSLFSQKNRDLQSKADNYRIVRKVRNEKLKKGLVLSLNPPDVRIRANFRRCDLWNSSCSASLNTTAQTSTSAIDSKIERAMVRFFNKAERTSDNDDRLVDLCEQTGLIIASTFKRNHRRHQLTWKGSTFLTLEQQRKRKMKALKLQLDYVLARNVPQLDV
ncbi:hypothetical protein RB195_024409 [Necator americanus]|uniref:Reverse transcriptase domain-containing protein n=1 Tax=Necator americanus TaxID=51031 RepID=A0ABR1EN17_NECAM